MQQLSELCSESKLAAVKGLADSDSDDDAEKWVQRQKSKVEVIFCEHKLLGVQKIKLIFLFALV